MDQAAKLMGDELARNSQMYLGKGGHILTFPIEKGQTMNGNLSPFYRRILQFCS